MTLRNDVELANTRRKLRELEGRVEALRHDSTQDQRVRRLTMTSLRRLINQRQEEIARYNTSQPLHQ